MKHLSESSDAPAVSLEQSSCWYRAATLTERAACWSTQDATYLLSESDRREKAEHVLQSWKARRPFSTGTFFAERLAMDGITEQDLLALLQEPLELLQERLGHPTAPDWVTDLLEALQTDLSASGEEQEKLFQEFAILQPFAPLLYKSVAHLHAAIQTLIREYKVLPFDPQTILSLLLPNLFQQIGPQVSKTVVLELNIARLRGQLREESPQERFQEYLRQLRQRSHLLPFLQEYCILARQILHSSQLWAENSQAFLKRLCADWQEIRTVFALAQDPGPLIAIVGGAGDPHRGGQSVMILTFRSGWRLMYKPRTLAIDVHFQKLLAWLNAQGAQPPFRLLNLLAKANYGWTEFVVSGDCASEEEVKRFYERQGGYLAILYALEASDFHHENVLAAGEYPMLIDLEALLQPQFSQGEGGSTLGQRVLEHSVLHTGLLPMHIFGVDENFDISGLALQSEGHLSPLPLPQWEGEGTDEMRLVRKHIEMKRGRNCPRLYDQDVQPLDYLEQIVSGFTALYRLLLANREVLLVNWVPRFAQDEIRFVPRATRTYETLLRESFHPNQLRDGLKRERFFDSLWMEVLIRPALKQLIPAERVDLLQGDIPLFTTHPESRDIWTSRGERLPSFFEKSGLEQVRERLQCLSEQDLSRQTWLILVSFACKAGEGASSVLYQPERSNRAPQQTIERQVLPLLYTGGLAETTFAARSLLTEAQAIGDWFCTHALQDEEQTNWFGIDYVGKRAWQITQAGLDLSGGLPGILLFLAYLGTLTKEARYTALAQAGVRTLHRLLDEQKSVSFDYIGIGAFTGLGSCIYLFSHLAVLWQDRSLLQEAEELVQHLPEPIKRDEQYNLMDGAAGCLASLLSLYSIAPSEQTLQMGKLCGEHLLAHFQPMWEGRQQEEPLLGYSCGAAGIAWSLFRLAAASGEERFRTAARAALAYEHREFSAERDNWPERRKCSDDQGQQSNQAEFAVKKEVLHSGMSWSFGAPDIAFGRLALLSDLDDVMMHAELEIALEATMAQGFGYSHEQAGPNDSLAHGNCGNLEVVLVAAQKLDTAQLHEFLERQTMQLLESIQQRGWIMGVPLNVPTPGLMLGLAGMGYQCLRLAEPERVPSILSLVPPSANPLLGLHPSE